MTSNELDNLVGMEATIAVFYAAGRSVDLPIKILDARTVYGREELLIKHEAGDEAWVSAERVRVKG